MTVVVAAGLAGCGGQAGGEPSGGDLAAEERRLREEERRTAEMQRRLDEAQARAAQGEREGDRQPQDERPARGDGVLFSRADAASFDRLSARLGGASGVAVSGLGTRQEPEVLGTLRTGPAWSTIKVPLALAAVEQRASGVRDAIHSAITASDNAAAERLWAMLGGGAAAGGAVEEILAAAGDDRTSVQTQRVRPGFTPFGQTQWSLAGQQRFMAGVSCLGASASEVLDLMENVVRSQRWGLGAVGLGAQLKGGWGPDPDGGYLVRQMGAVLLENRRPMAVSIITKPGDGTFASGTRNVTAIAEWAVEHAAADKLARAPRC